VYGVYAYIYKNNESVYLLNADSQYPLVHVSRDSNLYAVEQQTPQTPGHPGTATSFSAC
jgi:hypothetical protein